MVQSFRDFSLFRSGVDAAISMSAASCDSALNLIQLNLSLMRDLRELGSRTPMAVPVLGKPAANLSAMSEVVRPTLERVAAYGHDVQTLVGKAQHDISAIVDAQLEKVTQGVIEQLDQFAAKAPAGGEAAVAAIKSAMESAGKQYAGASKAAKEAGGQIQAGVSSVTGMMVQNMLNTTQAVAKKAA